MIFESTKIRKKRVQRQNNTATRQGAARSKTISYASRFLNHSRKAAALTPRKVPQCNNSWNQWFHSPLPVYHNVNINVAVQNDNGLYVPVIRDADKKGLAEAIKHLAQKAKDNSLKPEDYKGGTFTVSNSGGPFGVKQFSAIINPPQSGILAVGSAEKRVIPDAGPGEFKYASFIPVTLSCDHRVIDGAIGAEWLKAFKGYIENPESMLL